MVHGTVGGNSEERVDRGDRERHVGHVGRDGRSRDARVVGFEASSEDSAA